MINFLNHDFSDMSVVRRSEDANFKFSVSFKFEIIMRHEKCKF